MGIPLSSESVLPIQARGKAPPAVMPGNIGVCALWLLYWLPMRNQHVQRVFSLGPWVTKIGLESWERPCWALSPYRCRLLRAINSLAMRTKTSSMFLDSLADVSKTARRPYFSASVQASSNRTCRFSHRSDLFPTGETCKGN